MCQSHLSCPHSYNTKLYNKTETRKCFISSDHRRNWFITVLFYCLAHRKQNSVSYVFK